MIVCIFDIYLSNSMQAQCVESCIGLEVNIVANTDAILILQLCL